MKKLLINWLATLLLLTWPIAAQAQFDYATNNGAITIISYTGSGGAVIIPVTLSGYPVSSIGNYAFAGCFNLTSITIPDSVTNIGEFAFDECFDLTNIAIPNSVTSIGDFAFDYCSSLTNIAVDPTDPNFSSLNGVLFDKAQATLIQCPNGLNGSYTIPNGVTNIGDYAFANNYDLTSVTIPNSVASIGNHAFADCSVLTSIIIPNSVVKIGDHTFDECFDLTNITVDPANPDFSSLNGVLFDKAQVTLLQYPNSLNGSYTIPNSVASIGGFAFADCSDLTGIIIPNSITNIGVEAFNDCSNLTNITVDPANPDFSSLNGVLFDKAQAILIQYPNGLSGSYIIPNSVTNIGGYAFADCFNLTNITIPINVTVIGDDAFAYCNLLVSAYFLGNAPPDDGTVFEGDSAATAYYLPGATGWGATFGSVPAVLLGSQTPVLTLSQIAVSQNQFGFTVNGTNGQIIVVNVCTNLANPDWLPLQTNTLDGTPFNFTDPQWTSYPERFYRVISVP